MAGRINYYFLLGLSVEPLEQSKAVIQQAIVDKKDEWAKKKNSATDSTQYTAYLDMMPDIEAVMLDRSKRIQEGKQAQETLADKLDEIDSALAIAIENDKMDENTVPKLLVYPRFIAYGITEELVRKHCKSLQEKQEPETFELPEPSKTKPITKSLKLLGLPDLYAFLGCSSTASLEELKRAGTGKFAEANANPNKNAQVEAQEALASCCGTMFRTPADKQKYDNFVTFNRYPDLMEAIRTAGSMGSNAISTTSYEKMLSMAQSQYHLGVSDASAYIRLCCRVLGYDMGGNGRAKLVCASCGMENPYNALQCSQCGRPLKIECPKCGAKNENNAQTCVKCGFRIGSMNDALPYLRQAEDALRHRQIPVARQAIEQVQILWPNHPALRELISTCDGYANEENDLLGSIKHAIEDKQIFHARDLLAKARQMGVMMSGDQATFVKNSIDKVEQLVMQARAAQGDEAFDLLLSARALIVDHAELNAMMNDFPPLPPQAMQQEVRHGTVSIRWSASSSKGRVSYAVVRRISAPAASIEEGETVYTGEALACVDGEPMSCTEYCYAVFSVREGVASVSAACGDLIAVVPSVSDVKYVPGNGEVSISWTAAPTVTSVSVLRTDTQRALTGVRVNGVTDAGLQNGVEYGYEITALHRLSAREYFSESVVLRATPQESARAVEDLTISPAGALFSARWTPQHGVETQLFYAPAPVAPSGTMMELARAQEKLRRVDVQAQGEGMLSFGLEGVSDCYLTPLSYQGSYVVVGRAVRLTNVPAPTGLKGEVVNGDTLCLTLEQWPRGIGRLRVLFGTNDYPTGPEDAFAKGVSVLDEQYRRNSGVLIPATEYGEYFCAVYSEIVSAQGEILFSPPARVRVSHLPIQQITYSIAYKKAFLGKGIVAFSLSCASPTELPPFQLIARVGAPPVNRNSGEVIYGSNETMQITGKLEMVLPWSPPTKNVYFIKMYFTSAADYNRFTLLTRTPSINCK